VRKFAACRIFQRGRRTSSFPASIFYGDLKWHIESARVLRINTAGYDSRNLVLDVVAAAASVVRAEVVSDVDEIGAIVGKSARRVSESASQ